MEYITLQRLAEHTDKMRFRITYESDEHFELEYLASMFGTTVPMRFNVQKTDDPAVVWHAAGLGQRYQIVKREA